MKRKKYIHFVGIKGVGMAPLALIAQEAGCHVTGSDVPDIFITDKLLADHKIKIFTSFESSHLAEADLVVTTGAHGGYDNPEVVAARELGIRVVTQAEAVGIFMNGKIFERQFLGISITGTHGKTTTTALLATIFTYNRLDPSFLIGTSEIKGLDGPGHFGHGKYFIAEADEYVTEPTYDKTPKFLWQKPTIAVFTSLEYDHPDVYASEDELVKAFTSFTHNLEIGGLLVVNGDDANIQNVLKSYSGRLITYGNSPKNTFYLKKVSITDDRTYFWVEREGVLLGEFSLSVIGEHQALNALACLVVSLECGLSVEQIKRGLAEFKGSKRRSEYVGKLSTGAVVFDDYAHHPTEIRKTLHAFKQAYPKKKIVVIFQPHTYSRTNKLFEQFIHSFSDANEAILIDIYASLREGKDSSVSSQKLATEIERYQKGVQYLPSLEDVVQYLDQKAFDSNTIVISMGAGNVYKIWDHFALQ